MDDDEKKKLLEAYQNAPLIEPPKELPPIFVTPQTSDESLQNLAITLSTFPIENREGVQVFEVPKIADDCRSYVGRGYEAYQDTTAKNPHGSPIQLRLNWKATTILLAVKDLKRFTFMRGIMLVNGETAPFWKS